MSWAVLTYRFLVNDMHFKELKKEQKTIIVNSIRPILFGASMYFLTDEKLGKIKNTINNGKK